MLFRCPVCHQRSILFLTKLLHLTGGTNGRHGANQFECTACNADLRCNFALLSTFAYSFILYTAATIASDFHPLFNTSLRNFGSIGGIFTLIAFFLYPIYPAQNGNNWTGTLRMAYLSLFILALSALLRFR